MLTPGLIFTLNKLGFKKMKPLLYRLEGGGEFVHYLEFEVIGGPDGRLRCDYGVTNSRSLKFAIECLRRFGGFMISADKIQPPPFNTRCQVGRYCKWGIRDSIALDDLAKDGGIQRFETDLSQRIMPYFAPVVDEISYQELLIDGGELAPWIVCNGAVRAAELIWIGNVNSGITSSLVRSICDLHQIDIRSGLGKAGDPKSFLDGTISLADSWPKDAA